MVSVIAGFKCDETWQFIMFKVYMMKNEESSMMWNEAL